MNQDHHPKSEPGSCCSKASASPAHDIATSAGIFDGTVWRIANMDCASEESEIRNALAPIAGIGSLRFDLGRRTLALSGDAASIAAAEVAIKKAGFEPLQLAAADAQARQDANAHAADEYGSLSSGMARLGLALALAIAAELLEFFAPAALSFDIAKMALAAFAIWLAGFGTYKKGLYALRARRLNINALMTVAVTGAFLIGQWPEAAMVMALYAIAELIEARSVDRARNAIKGLLDMTPEDGRGQQADGSWAATCEGPCRRRRRARQTWRPHPLDGVIVTGSTSVDQSPSNG
jgi:Cd2+/Zn2+-exporting ATPase